MTKTTHVLETAKVDLGEVETEVVALHSPELYRTRAVINAIPGGFDAITDQHVALYQEYGFLAVNDFFTPDEVANALQGLGSLVMGENKDFRGLQFESIAKEKLQDMKADERMDYVRKLMWFVEFEPRLKALSHHPKMIAMVERLGKCKDPVMFQDMGLIKPPRIGREKPWHQDKAYFNIDLRETVVGTWTALDEATIENGCMHLMPDIPLKPVTHFKRRDWQICDTEILGKQCVAVPLKPGGVLFFDGLLVHGTPHNTSGLRRRAVQYHYRSSHHDAVSNETRMALFGSEGKDVQC